MEGDEKGRTNAQQGKHDDLVVAEALAFQADKLMPMVFKESQAEKPKYPRDYDVRQHRRRGELNREEILAENIVEF